MTSAAFWQQGETPACSREKGIDLANHAIDFACHEVAVRVTDLLRRKNLFGHELGVEEESVTGCETSMNRCVLDHVHHEAPEIVSGSH